MASTIILLILSAVSAYIMIQEFKRVSMPVWLFFILTLICLLTISLGILSLIDQLSK